MWTGVVVYDSGNDHVKGHSECLHKGKGFWVISGVFEFGGEIEEAYVAGWFTLTTNVSN